jgi:DNA polymerase II small subunit
MSGESIQAKDFSTRFEVVKSVGDNSKTEGSLERLQSLFQDRFRQMKKFIATNYGLTDTLKLKDIVDNRERWSKNEATAIIMVIESKRTKNGHLKLTVEDSTGEMDALLMLDVADRVGNIAVDDVVVITGSLSKDGGIFFVSNALFPNIVSKCDPLTREGVDPVSAAFISDIHVGAKTFLERDWMRMINWLSSDDETAKSIKYLVMSGDIIDGVGVYPNQQNELAIPDIFDQYAKVGEYMELLPDHIIPIILPGNHDAVRLAEPQPVLSTEVQSHFNRGLFVGNPCRFNAGGADILSYHGKSIDDMVMLHPNTSYDRPQDAMKEMLKRRHLAPHWGVKNQIAAEPYDLLTIDSAPDIFVTGHTHGHCLEKYKGIQMIVSSTWQSQTSFQKMVGFEPKPSILSVVKLDTLESSAVHFG